MKSVIFKTLTLTLLIYSCAGKEIQYMGINIPVKKEIKGISLNTTFIFSRPQEIAIIDSLLIIRDSYDRDSSFHVFNKTSGKHLKSFGYKGRGPGEVLYPSALNYIPKDQALTTIESNLKKIIKYNIANILSQTQPFFSEIKLNNLPIFALEAISCGEGFIVGGNSETRLAVIDTNSQILQQFYDYPKLAADEDENRAIFNYNPQYAMHPSGDKLVTISYIGGILEIFDIKDNKITSNVVKYINEPIYKIVSGLKPKWIGSVPGTVMGCSNIYPTKDYIYCIYEGELSKDPKIIPKKILVFDWKGNLLLQYEPEEGTPNNVAVDENYLYSVIVTKDGESQLYKYNYKD